MVKTCKAAVFIAVTFTIAATVALVSCSKSDTQPLDANLSALPKFITSQGDKFVIKRGNCTMTLSPASGGRIASLKYGDHEMLITEDQSRSTLWGSVLWSSPQTDWSWPPVEVLDIKPYHLSVNDNALVMTSDIDNKTGYQFEKHYSITGENAYSITYAIYNRSKKPKAVAPWELTRVPTRGTVLFPAGEKGLNSSIFYPMEVPRIDGIRWFHYQPQKIRDDHHKMMTDGKDGWLAYVDQHYLLVKKFPDVPVDLIAHNEGEVELFADANKTYLEIQQQGSMTMLQPGEHLEWTVIWYLEKLPASMSTEVGSTELVSYIRDLVAIK